MKEHQLPLNASERDALLEHAATKEECAESERGTASIFATAMNITLNVVGGGILSLPIAFEQATLGIGVLLMILLGAMSIFSMFLLTACAEKTRRYSYKELISYAFNERCAFWFECVLAFYTFGVLVVFLRIIGDTAPKVAGDFLGASGFTATPEFWIGASGIVVAVLSSMPNLTALRHTSFLGLLTVVYLGCAVVWKFFGDNPNANTESLLAPDVKYFGFQVAIFEAIPVISTSFSCHYNIPVFYGEMKNGTPKRMLKAVGGFCLITLPVYFIVGILSLLMFGSSRIDGPNAKGDVLNNFSDRSAVFNAARLGFCLKGLTSYPLVALACRRSLNTLLFGNPIQSQLRYIVEAVGLVLCSCTLAYFVPSIEDVFSINGALFGMVITLDVPCLLFLNIMKPDPTDELFESVPSSVKWARRAAKVSLVLGVALGVVSLVVTVLRVAHVSLE